MMRNNKKHPDEIIEILDMLRDVPDRDPNRRAAGKAQFLAEANKISKKTVSISWFARLIDVSQSSIPNFRLGTLTIGLILGIFLLTFSTTSFARQAQPDQMLYPLKLWLEDLRVNTTFQSESIIELRLNNAEERLREIEQTQLDLSTPMLQNSISNFRFNMAEAARLIAEDPANDHFLDRWNSLQVRFEELINRIQDDQDDKDKTSDDEPDQMEAEDIDDDLDEQDEPEDGLDDQEPNDRQEDSELEENETEDDKDETDDPEEPEEPDND